MSDDEEWFDVFDETETRVGTERRSVVHRTGLWHRATNVLMFVRAADGDESTPPPQQLLLQQRAAGKDVCPLAWDLSVAEHVKCGESYREAAVRGVREELGLSIDASRFVALRSEAVRFELHDAERGVHDCEFNVAFSVLLEPAEACSVVPDAAEVAATAVVPLPEVLAAVQADAAHAKFTPWLARELALFTASSASVTAR